MMQAPSLAVPCTTASSLPLSASNFFNNLQQPRMTPDARAQIAQSLVAAVARKNTATVPNNVPQPVPAPISTPERSSPLPLSPEGSSKKPYFSMANAVLEASDSDLTELIPHTENAVRLNPSSPKVVVSAPPPPSATIAQLGLGHHLKNLNSSLGMSLLASAAAQTPTAPTKPTLNGSPAPKQQQQPPHLHPGAISALGVPTGLTGMAPIQQAAAVAARPSFPLLVPMALLKNAIPPSAPPTQLRAAPHHHQVPQPRARNHEPLALVSMKQAMANKGALSFQMGMMMMTAGNPCGGEEADDAGSLEADDAQQHQLMIPPQLSQPTGMMMGPGTITDGVLPPHILNLGCYDAEGPRCEHVNHWKRLRAKRGYTYFVCRWCERKWRVQTSTLFALSKNVTPPSADSGSCSNGLSPTNSGSHNDIEGFSPLSFQNYGLLPSPQLTQPPQQPFANLIM